MTFPRRRGPVPRFSQVQLVEAAVSVVEQQGFGALSLRSVARELEVGPMTLYTYVDSAEELAGLVVDRLVGDAVADTRWRTGPREVLRQVAHVLDSLVRTHPEIVDAYGRGLMTGGRAREVAQAVQGRLLDAGLPRDLVVEAYLGVHAVVLGYAFVRAAGRDVVPLDALLDRMLDGLGL